MRRDHRDHAGGWGKQQSFVKRQDHVEYVYSDMERIGVSTWRESLLHMSKFE